VKINPHYTIESKILNKFTNQFEVKYKPTNITQSAQNYHVNNVVRDWKETVARVSEQIMDKQTYANIPLVSYDLPDGNMISTASEKYEIPEFLFEPKTGVVQMIYDVITQCDIDIKKELASTIILAGGSTCFFGFAERLTKELQESSNIKFKLVPTTTNDRKYGCWIGGSILASLGTFHQMWMSSEEYKEQGASMVESKCP